MTMRNIFSKKIISIISKKFLGLLMLAALLLSSVPAPAFAYYAPGETMNPSCAPGDSGCDISPITAANSGGTGLSSFTAGDLLYASATTTLAKLSIGADGKVLKVSSGSLSWEDDAGAGGGISSLNGLSISSQMFATSTTGSDFNIVSSGSTHTFNLPSASSTARGLLTAADWTTFNNKLDATLASGFLWIGNGSNQAAAVALSGDATLSSAGVFTISNDAVTLAKLAADAVNSAKIVDGSIALADLAGDSVDTAKIVDGTITNADVSTTAAIIYSKLALGNSIILSDLASDSVNSSKIVDGSIVAADLATDAVTSAKILDGTITNSDIAAAAAIALSKLASGTSGQIIVADAGGTPVYVALSGDAAIDNAGALTIANLAITNAKLAADAVTSAKILDGAVALADLAGDSVDSSKIVDGSIATTDVADSAITYGKMQNVSASKLLGNAAGTAAAPSEIGLGSGLQFTSGNLDVASSVVTSLAAPSGSSANGGSIANNILTLSLADGTNPGLVSTGTQTIAGSKTFSSAPTLSSMTAGSLLFAGAGGLVSQNNSNLFWDNTNNRLGIGTAAPSVNLDVVQNGAVKVGDGFISSGGNFLNLSSNNWNNGTAWSSNYEDRQGAVLQLTAGDIVFFSSAAGTGVPTFTTRMIVKGSGSLAGNVGIGDDSPQAMLTVGNGDLFQVNSSGNVVSVGGAAHSISNSSGALVIDSASAGAINLGAAANGKTITIGNTTAGTKVAINVDATQASSDISAFQVPKLITFENYRSATQLGYLAGNINEGNFVTFVGREAGYSNNTGGNNTALGYQSLYTNALGSSNTAIGFSALYSNVGGVSSSQENTAVGASALRLVSSGGGNVALGHSAGRTITTGSNNTFIGYYAGYDALQKVDAANSMALGNGAYTTADNQVVIGNSAITQTLLNGNVGIGTASPGSTLDVKGALRLSGSTSGYVGLVPAAAAGGTTYTLPSADGTSGQVLSTNGSGALSWASAAGGSQTPWTSAINAAGYTLNGNSTASGNLTLDSTSDATKGYVLINPTGGNVGIGTTGPNRKFELSVPASGALYQMRIGSGQDASAYTYDIGRDNGTGYLTFYGNEPALDGYVFSGVGGEKVRIQSSGNVGIGTTAPLSKLDVNGGVAVGSYAGVNSAPSNGMIISGNVGIGTANPTEGFQTNNKIQTARFDSGYGSASANSVAYWGLQDDSNNGGVTKGFVWRIDKPADTGSPANLTLRLVQGFSNSCAGYPFCSLSSINGTGMDAMTFAGNGNVGIGTVNPGSKLHVENDLNASAENWVATLQNNNSEGNTPTAGILFNVGDSTSKKSGILFQRTTTWGRGDLYFLNNNSADNSTPTISANTALVIKNSGNVGIGTASPGYKLEVAGDLKIGAGDGPLFYYGLSTITGTGGAAVCANTSGAVGLCTSLSEYKTNMTDITNALELIKGLRPVNYDWKDGYYNGVRGDIGLLAEEVQALDPRLAEYNTDGSLVGVRYDHMVALVVKGVQEQQAEIALLKTQIAAAENGGAGSITLDTLNQLTISGALSVSGHLALGADTVGEATVTSGSASIVITFTIPYAEKPAITVTPESEINGTYWVSGINANGFTINISAPQTTDTIFGWHAFAQKGKAFSIDLAPSNNPAPTEQPVVETPSAETPTIPEVPICTATQTLVDNACTDPASPAVAPQNEGVAPVVEQPVIVTPPVETPAVESAQVVEPTPEAPAPVDAGTGAAE